MFFFLFLNAKIRLFLQKTDIFYKNIISKANNLMFSPVCSSLSAYTTKKDGKAFAPVILLRYIQSITK